MRIEVSPLRLEEAEALVDLAQHIWRACYPGIISPEQIEYMLAQRYKPGLVKQLLARGDLWLAARAVWTAPGSVPSTEPPPEGARPFLGRPGERPGDELVGFAHAHALQPGDTKLDKLYVHPDYQRHGIGGLLIAEVLRHVRPHGTTRLILRVNRQNHAAIQAYLKHGFKVADLVVENIGEGYVMDDYVMVKEIDAS
jgi:ribosomal protein S18 acetylase RimI-like enzyme